MKLKLIAEDKFYHDTQYNTSSKVITIYNTEDQNTELMNGTIPHNIGSMFTDDGDTKYPDVINVISINQEAFDYTEDNQIKMLKLLLSLMPQGKIAFSDKYDIQNLVNELIDDGSLKVKSGNLINAQPRANNNQFNLLDKKFTAYSGNTKTKNTNNNLKNAVKYHAKYMKGQRWPELEQAFLYRANTYMGSSLSDYIRPRTSLFTYLNNIKEKWREGEKLADAALKKFLFSVIIHNDRYFKLNNDIYEYIYKRPNIMIITGLYRYMNWLWNITVIFTTGQLLQQSKALPENWINPKLLSTNEYDIGQSPTGVNHKDLFLDCIKLATYKFNLPDLPEQTKENFNPDIVHEFILSAISKFPKTGITAMNNTINDIADKLESLRNKLNET